MYVGLWTPVYDPFFTVTVGGLADCLTAMPKAHGTKRARYGNMMAHRERLDLPKI